MKARWIYIDRRAPANVRKAPRTTSWVWAEKLAAVLATNSKWCGQFQLYDKSQADGEVDETILADKNASGRQENKLKRPTDFVIVRCTEYLLQYFENETLGYWLSNPDDSREHPPRLWLINMEVGELAHCVVRLDSSGKKAPVALLGGQLGSPWRVLPVPSMEIEHFDLQGADVKRVKQIHKYILPALDNPEAVPTWQPPP